MASHRLTRVQKVRGLRKCLRSPRTPRWLRPSIRRYLRKLEQQLRREGPLK